MDIDIMATKVRELLAWKDEVAPMLAAMRPSYETHKEKIAAEDEAKAAEEAEAKEKADAAAAAKAAEEKSTSAAKAADEKAAAAAQAPAGA